MPRHQHKFSRETQERIRQARITAVMDHWGVGFTVAESMVKDWYRGRGNKRRAMAETAIREADLLFEMVSTSNGKNYRPELPRGLQNVE